MCSFHESAHETLALSRFPPALLPRPHEAGVWSDGLIGLWVAQVGKGSCQQLPLSFRDGILAADARLDYRDSLICHLKTAGVVFDVPSDEDLIAAAYQVWGQRCVWYLEGDYAFVLWDQRERHLFGARSISGLRPFVFARQGKSLICASEAKQILLTGSIDTTFDDRWMNRWLLFGQNHQEYTPYRSIQKLQPGWFLFMNEQGLSVQPYFQLETVPRQTSQQSQQEVTEQFRALLFESVCSHLQAKEPLLVDISGGLDSSSIAAVAGSLRKQNREIPPLVGVHAYSPRHLEKDDRALAEKVAKQAGIENVSYLSYDEFPLLTSLSQTRQWSDTPSLPTLFFASLYDQIGQIARDLGIRGHVRGDFGDQLVGATSGYLGELAMRGQYLELFREVRLWQRIANIPLSEVLSSSLSSKRGKERKALSPAEREEKAPWLRTREGAVSLYEQEKSALATRISHPFFLERYQDLHLCEEYVSMQNDGIVRAGREIRAPYLDQRLMTYLFSLPPQYQLRFKRRKFLLREAMRGLLPEEVRGRTGKGRMARLLFESIAREKCLLQDLILSLPHALEPYLDAVRLAREVERAAFGAALDQRSFFSALALVIWAHRLPWLAGRLS